MSKLSRKQSKQLINSIYDSQKSILLFTADWCHACKEVNTLFDNISNKLANTCNVQKINIDNELFESVTLQYKVVTIPTIITLESGKIKEYITNITDDTFNILIENELNNTNIIKSPSPKRHNSMSTK